MEDDKKLIFAYLNGDSNAFSLLVSKYLKSVYNFAFWFSHDPVMSEDITQESFRSGINVNQRQGRHASIVRSACVLAHVVEKWG
jgi:DNA-directed RNA polymerase specialized sigma24 family protein